MTLSPVRATRALLLAVAVVALTLLAWPAQARASLHPASIVPTVHCGSITYQIGTPRPLILTAMDTPADEVPLASSTWTAPAGYSVHTYTLTKATRPVGADDVSLFSGPLHDVFVLSRAVAWDCAHSSAASGVPVGDSSPAPTSPCPSTAAPSSPSGSPTTSEPHPSTTSAPSTTPPASSSAASSSPVASSSIATATSASVATSTATKVGQLALTGPPIGFIVAVALALLALGALILTTVRMRGDHS